jgi:hypothetical protein
MKPAGTWSQPASSIVSSNHSTDSLGSSRSNSANATESSARRSRPTNDARLASAVNHRDQIGRLPSLPAMLPMKSRSAGRTGEAAPRDGGTSPSMTITQRQGSLCARSATSALAELWPTNIGSWHGAMRWSRWDVQLRQAGGGWLSRTSGIWTLCPDCRSSFAVGSQLDARTNGPGTRTKFRLTRARKRICDRRHDTSALGEGASLPIPALEAGRLTGHRSVQPFMARWTISASWDFRYGFINSSTPGSRRP